MARTDLSKMSSERVRNVVRILTMCKRSCLSGDLPEDIELNTLPGLPGSPNIALNIV